MCLCKLWFSLDICQGMRLLDHIFLLFLVFLRNLLQFSVMDVLIYIPTNSVGGFTFLHIFSTYIVFIFFDNGSHKLLIAKFRLKFKKIGKTTRPSRYDINQIPYNYTVEVTNRFKGFELIECLKNYGQRFMTLYRIKPSTRKRNAKRQNGCLRRPCK